MEHFDVFILSVFVSVDLGIPCVRSRSHQRFAELEWQTTTNCKAAFTPFITHEKCAIFVVVSLLENKKKIHTDIGRCRLYLYRHRLLVLESSLNSFVLPLM